MNRCAQGIVALALALGPLMCFGDSSYQETTQMTGGQLVDSLKSIPFMSKQLKSLTDPTTTTTMVHGNQKAVVTKQSTEIYDLDQQEIIHIDTVKKQYSIDTFADMRKMMAQMPDAIKQAQAQAAAAQAQAQQAQAPASNLQYSFSVSVNNTGLQQVLSGLNATQQILTLTAIVTDPSNPGTSATYTTTTEIWTTPDLPEEMKDSQDFDTRFAQALMSGVDLSAYLNMWTNTSSTAMTQMFTSNPGAAGAFAQMGKEMAKIKGTPILEKTSMGGSGTGAAQPQTGNTANANSGPADSGTGGGVMAKGMTGLVGLLAKKKSQPANPPPASTSSAPPGETVLMEMTTQKTNFSLDPIPASAFQVPSGFTQVPSPLAQALAKQQAPANP
jgi:hypothetical protein